MFEVEVRWRGVGGGGHREYIIFKNFFLFFFPAGGTGGLGVQAKFATFLLGLVVEQPNGNGVNVVPVANQHSQRRCFNRMW